MARIREATRRQRQPDLASARRFGHSLIAQGFWPTVHFVQRYLERGIRQGIRIDGREFGRMFDRAAHYAQTRPGYTTRIAIIQGLPILYRLGGRTGQQIVLVGMLPADTLPPSERVRPPQRRPQREWEAECEV